MNRRLLTFEVVGDSELEIHGNAEGVEDLIKRLRRVLELGQHDHLMTPSWGGTELSEEPQTVGSKLVNKVTIRAW